MLYTYYIYDIMARARAIDARLIESKIGFTNSWLDNFGKVT